VQDVAFSPDGRLALTAGANLRLWDVATGREVRVFIGEGPQQPFRKVVWSADGRRIAISGTGGKVFLRDASGSELRVFDRHTTDVHALAFSPDGQYLVTGAGGFKYDNGKLVHDAANRPVLHDTDLRMWDVATGREVRRFRGHASTIRWVAFSPDGRQIFSGGNSELAILVWDVEKETAVRRIPMRSNLFLCAFSADGSQAAVVLRDAIGVFDLQTGQPVHTLPRPKRPRSLALSRDGRFLAVAFGQISRENNQTVSHDSTVQVYHVPSGEIVREVRGFTHLVWALDLSSDGQLLLAASMDHKVFLRRVSGPPALPWTPPGSPSP
jgi:WD40 repeat protein